MKKSFATGIALSMLTVAVASVFFTPASQADSLSATKKMLMKSTDKCEMKQKTDERESCMDDAWAAYKEASKK